MGCGPPSDVRASSTCPHAPGAYVHPWLGTIGKSYRIHVCSREPGLFESLVDCHRIHGTGGI